MIPRSSYAEKEGSARRYIEAQAFRSAREPSPCGYCGARSDAGCKHWKAVAAEFYRKSPHRKKLDAPYG